MRELADSAERQKLKAIGQRMKLQYCNSKEAFHREEVLLRSRIEAKEKEFERNKSYLADLERAAVSGQGQQDAASQ